MSADALMILVLGGYGSFGGRLVRLLADEPRLTLIVAGRSLEKAQAFCGGMTSAATLRPEAFDRDGDVAAGLRALAPDIVVDASGPFQAYGDGYRLVEAAIAQRISYLDLADGTGFVAGISQFDAQACAAGVFVLSGASSVPALSSAVVRALSYDMALVESVATGIAPSPRAGVGLNVIRAIASYAGRPVAVTANGRRTARPGLIDSRTFTIAPPGCVPLGPLRFSLVDAPDLRVLDLTWPGLKNVWVGASPRPAFLHRVLSLAAHAVRWRLAPSLAGLSSLMHGATAWLRFGEHRGGMIVAVEGRSAVGTGIGRSWHLIAEGDDGPFIPAMAAAAVVRACLSGNGPPPGARPAVAQIPLAEFEAEFARFAIRAGVREAAPPDWPLFRKLLGSAWDGLPISVRALHAPGERLVVSGRASVERGTSLLSRLAGRIAGFPPAMPDVPVRLEIVTQEGRETWTRTFGAHVFASRLAAGAGRCDSLLCERFGPLTFGIALVAEADRLLWVMRRWSLFGIPLPSRLAPSGSISEFASDGRFHFDVEVALPLAGRVVRYRGWLA